MREKEDYVADNFIKSYCKVGLTATPLREDDGIQRSMFLLGCKLFESNWSDLCKQGYIAELNCIEVSCGIGKLFYSKYRQATDKRSDKLVDLNWAKKMLEQQGDREKME